MRRSALLIGTSLSLLLAMRLVPGLDLGLLSVCLTPAPLLIRLAHLPERTADSLAQQITRLRLVRPS